MIKELAFVVYPVSDMARARAFYEGSLGLKVENNWQDKWVEYDVRGVAFAISNMLEGHTPGARGAAVAFEVDDLDAYLAGLRAKGVKFLMEAITTPGCRMAAVADPDNNGLIIHRRNSP